MPQLIVINRLVDIAYNMSKEVSIKSLTQMVVINFFYKEEKHLHIVKWKSRQSELIRKILQNWNKLHSKPAHFKMRHIWKKKKEIFDHKLKEVKSDWFSEIQTVG